MITPIIKPTVDCNLDCNYCYEGENKYKSSFMSEDTLENVIKKIAIHNGEKKISTFIWHGGEPLLMGTKFFKQITEIQDSMPDFNFVNNLQTNGTLLNDDTLQVIKNKNFSIAVSLDGPAYLNDKTRRKHDGKGTYDEIIDGIKKVNELTDCEKPLFVGTLAVVNRNTLGNLDDFIDYFINNKLSVRINPIFYEGNARNAKSELGITAKEYADAMIYIFDKWFYSNNVIPIDPLYEMLGNLIHGKALGCVFAEDCFAKFLEIAPNGDVYPCSGGATNSFCLGNINSDSIDEILKSSVLKEFKSKREISLDKCKDCDYATICNAGCLRKSYMRRRRLDDKDYYCSAYKMIYSHLDNTLKTIFGSDYRNNKPDENCTVNPLLKRLLSYKLDRSAIEDVDWQDSTWGQWRGDSWSGDNKWTGHSGCY